MRYHVLACDYDGTIAHDGKVDRPTVAALERLLASGRKLILVTGRELEQLLDILPEVHFFSLVVAENGALLYQPASKTEKLLCQAPPPEFVRTLQARGVQPMSVGRAIVATWRPHETTVLKTIRDLGLEMQVIFNKDAVMVLPSGVNKATGLTMALAELGYTPHEAVGVGDAENDHAFLSLCECSAAVANALPSLKKTADINLQLGHGAGVAELIGQMVDNDLAALQDRLSRHQLLLGQGLEGQEVTLAPHGHALLIAGPSGSGKSTVATSLIEQLANHRYRFCIIDPEGDYDQLEGAVTVGNRQHGPTIDEVMQVVMKTRENAVVVNLIGLPLGDRPPFFVTLLPRLQELRARTGQPHWFLIDEAHHLVPANWEPGPRVLTQEFKQTVFITVHPGQMARPVLAAVDRVLLVGKNPDKTLEDYYTGLGEPVPEARWDASTSPGVILWSRAERTGLPLRTHPSRLERRRHLRKYAEGELPPERSFYYQGPQKKLNLRAQNLILFMQLGDGVDDETWTYHLQQGDYTRWFRDKIKDETLANQAAALEKQDDLTPAESRARMRALIEHSYTLPTGTPLPMPGTSAQKAPQK